ncbi:hypothetical protein NKJ28_14255 [Mesorhizobium sp. M0145]|uniref:hypothetical protein n=1 Tax=Mesorhizobium sp. M0145 TaxID=2956895 RepID=UPI00333AC1F4
MRVVSTAHQHQLGRFKRPSGMTHATLRNPHNRLKDRCGMRILSLAAFRSVHRQFETMLRDFSTTARGRKAFDADTLQRMERRKGMSLFAVNVRSRIQLAWAADREFAKLVSRRRDEEFYFVTLSPKEFAIPIEMAPSFDHKSLRMWAKEQLRGLNYVGMIEAAYYSNYNPIPGRRSAMVSWHVHAIVWGCSARRITAVVERVNAVCEPLIPCRAAAHARGMAGDTAAKRIFYMLKIAINNYRVYAKKGDVVDQLTGEVTVGNTGEMVTRKSRLRPGQAVKMAVVMGNRTLPVLMFSAGEGAVVWIRARALTRSKIRHADEIFRRKIDSLF